MAYRKILVGTDGSPTSLLSVKEAAQLAKASNAELVILCAYQPLDVATIEKWKAEAPAELSWRFTGSAVAEEAATKGVTAAAEEGVKARTRVEEGEAADTLINAAETEGADLIVVGNRGMSGATRFLLGSVPNKVSHHAPCDLMIVKTTD